MGRLSHHLPAVLRMMPTPTRVRFRQVAAPPGVRQYLVISDSTELGTVTRRQGGWWRAITTAGDIVGSWHSTRTSAAEALARSTITPTTDN